MNGKCFFIGALVLLILTGCDFGNAGDSSTADNPTELEGTWVSPCYADVSKIESAVTAMAFTGQSFVYSGTFFSGYNCIPSVIYGKMTIYGRFALGETVPAIYPTKKIDNTITSVSYTPLSDSIANAFNQSHTCGFDDWIINVEKDITGRGCSAYGTVGTRYFNIFGLDWSRLVLFLGDGDILGATNEAQRPTGLVLNQWLEKQ